MFKQTQNFYKIYMFESVIAFESNWCNRWFLKNLHKINTEPREDNIKQKYYIIFKPINYRENRSRDLSWRLDLARHTIVLQSGSKMRSVVVISGCDYKRNVFNINILVEKEKNGNNFWISHKTGFTFIIKPNDVAINIFHRL